jgi:hypothetical protein
MHRQAGPPLASKSSKNRCVDVWKCGYVVCQIAILLYIQIAMGYLSNEFEQLNFAQNLTKNGYYKFIKF